MASGSRAGRCAAGLVPGAEVVVVLARARADRCTGCDRLTAPGGTAVATEGPGPVTQAHAFARARAVGLVCGDDGAVSEATRARAAALAASRGSSIGEVVDQALSALETADFWRKTQGALRRRPVELDEDPVWELSVGDGLERV